MAVVTMDFAIDELDFGDWDVPKSITGSDSLYFIFI